MVTFLQIAPDQRNTHRWWWNIASAVSVQLCKQSLQELQSESGWCKERVLLLLYMEKDVPPVTSHQTHCTSTILSQTILAVNLNNTFLFIFLLVKLVIKVTYPAGRKIPHVKFLISAWSAFKRTHVGLRFSPAGLHRVKYVNLIVPSPNDIAHLATTKEPNRREKKTGF